MWLAGGMQLSAERSCCGGVSSSLAWPCGGQWGLPPSTTHPPPSSPLSDRWETPSLICEDFTNTNQQFLFTSERPKLLRCSLMFHVRNRFVILLIILGLIRRNIVYKEKELIIPLYQTIVRPHLEYCIQAWRPYRKKDIDMLERVQRRATKMIPKLRNISYEMRLKECGLTTLETRRLRGDQIEVFKILNGYENIDRNIFFTVKEERRTRGHGVTLAKKQCRLDIRKF